LKVSSICIAFKYFYLVFVTTLPLAYYFIPPFYWVNSVCCALCRRARVCCLRRLFADT